MRAVPLQGASNVMLKEFLTSGLAVSAANVCTNPIGVCAHSAQLPWPCAGFLLCQ